MNNTNDGPTPQDRLPDSLVEELDSLDVPALRAVYEYVEQRLGHSHDQIRAEAEGELLGIEDRGAYTLVWQESPRKEGTDGDSPIIGLYHVTRELHSDGEESLHWAFLGGVQGPLEIQCSNCGTTVEATAEICPECGEEVGIIGGGE